jgi:hypothetical protein
VPLPAGCVRIDSALGEVPPDIFGGVLVVDRLSALARGGRRVRAARGHQAASAAGKAERDDVRRRKRAERERAHESRLRGLQPKSRAGVHAFHAKRQVLCPPYASYDPYSTDTAARRGGLWQDLADATRSRAEAEREVARRALPTGRAAGEKERGPPRAWGRACGRPAREPARSRSTYFPRPPDSSRCLGWVPRLNPSGSCRWAPSRVVPNSPVG